MASPAPCCGAPFPLPPRNPANAPPALFKSSPRPLRICAPMVRYSKHPFRLLCYDQGVDLCYSPMMLAKEFIRSPEARLSDFTTSCRDAPVVAQFGGKSPLDFARASEMIAPYVDGVSLNCGCPQSWALAEGVGCALMAKPELVKEMVLAVKKRCPGLSVGVKIRVHKDIEETVRWVKIVEGSGVDYVTVHGRMRSQMGKGPVDYAKIKRIKETLKCPVVVNGGITSLEDERRVLELTGCDGTMTAQSLLSNPCLYAGLPYAPTDIIHKFLDYCSQSPIPVRLAVHHLEEMCGEGDRMRKSDKIALNACMSWVDLIDWFEEWRDRIDGGLR